MYTRRIVGIHIYTYTYRHGRQTRLQVVVVTRTYWRQQSFHDMFRTYILYTYIYNRNIITNNTWHMPYKKSKYRYLIAII